jgi:hypothetical protein
MNRVWSFASSQVGSTRQHCHAFNTTTGRYTTALNQNSRKGYNLLVVDEHLEPSRGYESVDLKNLREKFWV